MKTDGEFDIHETIGLLQADYNSTIHTVTKRKPVDVVNLKREKD